MPFDTLAPADDLAALSNDALADEISGLAAHLHAATHRLLMLVAEWDRRGTWAGHGAKSCAHWLTWACGIGPRAARDKVRVARALEDFPLISVAFARGELSFCKVRAIVRIATPDNEADLVDMARHGTGAQVSKMVRLTRRALAAAETDTASRRHAYRRAYWGWEDDGSMTLRCTLPPETAERVRAALDAVMDRLEAEAPPDPEWLGDDESYPQSGTAVPFDLPAHRETRRADALAWMAERVLEGGAMPPGLAANGHEIVVHVDAEVLKDRGPGRCEAEDGSALAAETVRRIACDCAVVPVVENAAGEPLSVGRRTRSIPPAMRRALQSRDRGCRFPGCGATYRLHGHHVRHWADGGETALDNLVLLCPFHHRLVHEGGFGVEPLDDGALRFTRPGGAPVRPPSARRETPSAETLLESNARRGVAVDARTCIARWDGWPVDYHFGVLAYVQGWNAGGSARDPASAVTSEGQPSGTRPRTSKHA